MKNEKKVKLEPLTFEEAKKFFKGKVVMEAKAWAWLTEEMRQRAFTVANVATLDIVQNIYDELLNTIENGGTLKEFQENINEYIEEKGYTGLTPYRADNIFRTNIQTAYNAGRYRQQTSPAVVKSRPVLIYSAVNDKRTRPAHRAMHGVARYADDPFWDTWYPPNGYRCRCSVRSASMRQVEKWGVKIETGEPPAVRETKEGQAVNILPDVGFDTNPGKTTFEPDLKKYDPKLQAQYKEKQERL